MSKDFVGTGHGKPNHYDVHIEHNGQRSSLTHSVNGSNVDYQWDGGGPGSTDLARALLWVVTGVDPEWRTYRLFKNEIVATWPRRVGECWRISEEEIRQWMAGLERDTVLSENVSQTAARSGQSHNRELRLKGFTGIFKSQ